MVLKVVADVDWARGEVEAEVILEQVIQAGCLSDCPALLVAQAGIGLSAGDAASNNDTRLGVRRRLDQSLMLALQRINFPKHSVSEDNRKDRGDPVKNPKMPKSKTKVAPAADGLPWAGLACVPSAGREGGRCWGGGCS